MIISDDYFEFNIKPYYKSLTAKYTFSFIKAK